MNKGEFSALSIAGLLVAHCAGMVDLVVLPVWIGALINKFGFSAQEAGGLVTGFLLGAVVASATIAPLFNRLPRRLVAGSGFIVSAVAFAICARGPGAVTLAALHVVAGVATGIGLSFVHGAFGRSKNPHRLYAISGIALGAFAAVVLGGLPVSVSAYGGQVVFLVIAAAMGVAGLAIYMAYPADARMTKQHPHHVGKFPPILWRAIFGICLMTFNNAMIFSFLDVIGRERGFADGQLAIVFVVMGFLNFLVIAPLAAVLEKRIRAENVMVAGPLAQLAIGGLITNATGFPVWAGAAVLYTGVLILTHTFAFGFLSKEDPSGRAVAGTPAMLMVGAAMGPFLGGVLGQAFGFEVLAIAAAVIGISASFTFLSLRRRTPVPALAE